MPDGGEPFGFEIASAWRDESGPTLRHEFEIAAFRQCDRRERIWAYL
jgi:hypothetical protein